MKNLNISLRANRILNCFLASIFLILIRVWYLSVIQYDAHFKESKKPQRRQIIEKTERGSIRDRFNIPLAVNTLQYNVAICYADIRQIPSVKWEKDFTGKKRRTLARLAYIQKLSQFLGESLDMDPQSIEDMINGKACLFPHTPFVLKEDIPESLYYRLKAKEKDWLGIQIQKGSKRIYPQGKVGSDIVGYMGAIGEKEYLKIAHEMETLKTYLKERADGKAVVLPQGFSSPAEVAVRLKELEERAYSINDLIGKSGVEGFFDEHLRGKSGNKIYEVDIKGNILSELPGGKPAVSGDRLILSISSELQEEAEKLLAEYEDFQDARDLASPNERITPWQRGGAIVAMDPNTGEILALASYPRFDPNDLVPSQTLEKRKEQRSSIIKWFESESYIGEIWDGKRPMQRERFSDGEFYTEEYFLTWSAFLDFILPKNSLLRKTIDSIDTLDKAVFLQEDSEIESYLEGISHERDKHLFSDLLRMVVKKECFSESLLDHVGGQTLSDFRLYCQTAARHLDPIKELVRTLFHQKEFKQWREKHFHEFIREKRKKEKALRKYSRPFTEYLEKQEQEMFAEFWKNHRNDFLYAFVMETFDVPYGEEIRFLREKVTDPRLESLKELLTPLNQKDRNNYFQALRTFEDLNRPLLGKYPLLRSKEGMQFEKHLASAFYPYSGFGFGRSQAFRQASPMGSIFKLVPAYAGLKQNYLSRKTPLNPLTIIDDMQWAPGKGTPRQLLGYLENGEPIHRFYKGGRLPRAYPKIGKIDLIKAIERSSNIYFSLLAGDILHTPSILLSTAIEFGLGSCTGIDLPGEYKGILPDDIMHNKTGLYSFAIGQHSLVGTPLQTAVMLSTIANGGKLLKPQIVKLTAGKNENSEEGGFISFREPEVKENLFFPEEIRKPLIMGMHRVINGEKGSARPERLNGAFHNPESLKAYEMLRSQLIGKTSTAEILYKQTIDAETPPKLEKHVGFGAISFEDEALEHPELVVIVYLRFGSAGRQGAPMAASIIDKWREIKERD